MKNKELKKKITINYITAAMLVITLFLVFFLYGYEEKVMNEKVITLDNEISNLKSQYNDLQSKSADIKKYVNMWENISENKKTISGIRLDDITEIVTKTAERYLITDSQIKVANIPQLVQGGIFNCKTISVIFTKVSINFSAINDIKALMFIDDLFSRIPGYGVINSLEIKKSKDYSTEDLIKISSGKGGNIIGNVEFTWYAYRQKEGAEQNQKTQINKENDAKKSQN